MCSMHYNLPSACECIYMLCDLYVQDSQTVPVPQAGPINWANPQTALNSEPISTNRANLINVGKFFHGLQYEAFLQLTNKQ